MLIDYFRKSVAARLYAIILTVVFLMSFLGGYFYILNTKDLVAYEQILSTLSHVNSLPFKVSDTVNKIMRYRDDINDVLEQEVVAEIETLTRNTRKYIEACHNDDCRHSAEGLNSIILNLQQTANEVFQYSKRNQVTEELYQSIDLLGIIVDVSQTNVQRFISIELDYASQLRQRIADQKRGVKLLILMSSGFLVALLGSLLIFVRHSVIAPLVKLQNALIAYHENRKVIHLETRSQDEIGRLATVFNEMLEAIKKREQKILESEKRYRTIIDNLQDVYCRTTLDGQIEMISPSASRIFGYPKGFDFTGLNIQEILYVDPRDQVTLLDHLAKSRALTNYELLLKKNNRTPINVISSLAYYYDENGNVSGIEGILTDITDLKQANQRLEDSKEEFRQLYQQAPVMLHNINTEGVLIEVNRYWLETLGYTRVEVLGKQSIEFMAPESRQQFIELFPHLHKNLFIKDNEFQFITKKGETIDTIVSANMVKDFSGEWTGARVAIVNVTEHKRAMLEKEKLTQQLHQAQKLEAIGTLAGGIEHDFNNILGVIVGQAELIDIFNSEEGSPIKSRLNQILEASERAKNLVMQILTISRISTFATVPVDLVPLAKEVVKFIRSSTPSTIAIRQNIAGDKMVVLSDPSRMHQVFLNLCTNAVQAMEASGGMLDITIRSVELDETSVTQYPALTAGSYIMVVISDTGPGMPPDVKEKIFEPYFTTKREGEGTGLGLAVVHGIVKNQGGHVSVYSALGKGTTFRVLLPQTDDDGSTFNIKQSEELIKGNESVLLVDDEEQLLMTASDILIHLGYKVTTCIDPVEALNLFKEFPSQFDLVITDLTMPNLTGIQLIRELKKIQLEIPVILCSGFGRGVTEESAEKEGVNAFLYKPLTTRLLSQTIRSILTKE